MKLKSKAAAYLLAISMMAASLPSISSFAEEAPTSGTFNEIFSWELSGDTLTFKVDENYTDEHITLDTGGRATDYELKPWRDYLPQVKHIVLDEKIYDIDSTIWSEFSRCYTDESINFETVTVGEGFDVEYSWHFGDAVVIAPKYSYTDYSAFQIGVSFESNGIAKEPYYEIVDEENKVEYVEDLSLLRMSGAVNDASSRALYKVQGRYRSVLLQDGAYLEKESETDLITYFKLGLLALPNDRSDLRKPIVLCYPSIGEENIKDMRSLNYSKPKVSVKLAVLGEANPELKGDANLDGIVDMSDATAALEYYAKRTAGLDASFKDDEELNKFSYYLADTDTESINGADSEDAKVDISDATNILTYYAQSIAGLEPDWNNIVSK